MPMAATYMEFLEDEGMQPTLDSSGAVIFESRGRFYYLIVDDDDPQYFRLLYPNFWSLDGSADRQRALLAAAEVTAGIKVAKVYVLGEDAQAAAEMFLADPRDLHQVFARTLRALQGAVRRFSELMQDRPRLRLVHSEP